MPSLSVSLLLLPLLLLALAALAHPPHPLSRLEPALRRLASAPGGARSPRPGRVVATVLPASVPCGAGGPCGVVGGDRVRVQWFYPAGIAPGNRAAWVGLFSPPPANLSALGSVSPAKYTQLGSSEGVQEEGELEYRLVNMRDDYQLLLLDADGLVAHSPVLTMAGKGEPMHGHLVAVPDGEATAAATRLVWTSLAAGAPEARWGVSPGHLGNKAAATSSAYSAGDMCGAPADGLGWRDPGVQHAVLMAGLRPGTRYYYQFGDARAGAWSDIRSFVAPRAEPPAAGDPPSTVIVYGDAGVCTNDDAEQPYEYCNATAVARAVFAAAQSAVDAGAPAFVHLIGDLAYARGYGVNWEEWGEQMDGLPAPMATTEGNHERDFLNFTTFHGYDSGGECSVPYEARYPRALPWASYTHGGVLIVSVNTEREFRPGSPQWLWAQARLAAVDREATPWVVFTGHRPLYVDTVEPLMQNISAELRAAFEPMITYYRVDLAVFGHHHSQQRTCDLLGGQCQPEGARGVPHLVVGTGGCWLANDFEPKRPPWVEYASATVYGYTRIDATRTTLTARFVGLDGKVHDQWSAKRMG